MDIILSRRDIKAVLPVVADIEKLGSYISLSGDYEVSSNRNVRNWPGGVISIAEI
jgi:hypothetical protein